MDHGLTWSAQECSHPSSRAWTHPELQHTTSRDHTDANQFIATQKLMGPRTSWWIYWSSEQLKDATTDMGISVLGLVPLWTWIPNKEGLTPMTTDQSLRFKCNACLRWTLQSSRLTVQPTSRPMSPACAPQYSGVSAASHLSLQQRLRISIGNCSLGLMLPSIHFLFIPLGFYASKHSFLFIPNLNFYICVNVIED